METVTKTKKDIRKFIKKELATILTNLSPGMNKKDFKKSIRKAGKVLYRGAKKGKLDMHPVEMLKATS